MPREERRWLILLEELKSLDPRFPDPAVSAGWDPSTIFPFNGHVAPMLRRLPRWLGAGLAASAAGGGGFAAYKYHTDEGVKRTMRFGWATAPMCMAYARAERKEMDALHEKWAPEMLRIVLDMRGYYIKAAQMLCGVGVLPKAYEESLKVLLDDVPARDPELIRSLVEKEFGVPISDLFSEFQDNPIGAASIGQVHLATLKDSGQQCVIKVQYPEVEEFFRLDVETIKAFCKLAMPDANTDQMFDEVAKSFVSEFDYRLEAGNLRIAGENLEKAGFASKALIPKPVDAKHPKCPPKFKENRGGSDGLCSRKVMVMDAVDGKPVKKVMQQVFQEMAEAQGMTTDDLLSDMKKQFEDPVRLREMLSQPPPSELGIKVGLFAMRLQEYAWNSAAFCYNYTAGLFAPKLPYEHKTIPPNGVALTRLLYDIHGHQVFRDGRFNADPHPGNVLICNDGRIGLVDYGNMPTLSEQERIDLARLIVALDNEDDPAIVDAFSKLGFTMHCTQKNDATRDKFLLMSAYGDFDQQYGTTFFNEHFNFPPETSLMELVEKIDAEMKGAGIEIKVPANVINIQRLVMVLNGVSNATGAGNVRPSTMWRKKADELLKELDERQRKQSEDNYFK